MSDKVKITRDHKRIQFSVASAATEIGPINFSEFCGIGMIVPSQLNGRTVTAQASDRENGTYATISGFSWSIVTGANVPDSTNIALLFPFPFIKLILNSAPGADITVTVALKG